MALIKGKKEDVTATVTAKKSSLFRPGDFSQGAFVEKPESPPPPERDESNEEEESARSFEEGLPVPAPPVAGKVLGGRSHNPTATSLQLPAYSKTIRIPTGAGDVEEYSPPGHGHNQGQGQSQGGETQSFQNSHPQHHHGPPIDQAIIEEAQQRANQILQEAQAAANQMLMEYQTQAQQMMEQANQQIQMAAEQIQRQAQEVGLQNGYQEGLQSGAAAAQQQVNHLILQVRDLYVQAIKQRQWLMSSVEPELARLSVKVAEKILGQEVQSQPECIIGIVKAALSGLGDREEVCIRVNPTDFDSAHAQKHIFERMVEGLKKFEIVADQAIEQGGCSIETNLGNVDARLTTQIATLTAALEEASKAHEQEIKEEIDVQVAQMMQEGGG